MNVEQIVNQIFEREQKEGALSKETIKKVIEKFVDEHVKLSPTSAVEQDTYALAATGLTMLVYQKAKDLGIDITIEEICQTLVKAFAKHSLNNQ